MSDLNCYDFPQYWDLAFRDETAAEADFIEAASSKYCEFPVRSMLEPGCGGGRLIHEMASRGFDVNGFDLSTTAVQYAQERLAQSGLSANVFSADMIHHVQDPVVDLAFNTMNTFRHLLSESDAAAHLQSVADSLRSGGIYILGFHMIPLDADEEDSEEWTVEEGPVKIDLRLNVDAFDRTTRIETLRFNLEVNDAGNEVQLETSYQMRIYQAWQFKDLIKRVPAFTHVGTYDFWYDINEPQEFSEELGDTVIVLQKQ